MFTNSCDVFQNKIDKVTIDTFCRYFLYHTPLQKYTTNYEAIKQLVSNEALYVSTTMQILYIFSL